ncbi:Metallo-dependent phosphatase [Macrolepiota fuliginosa MF-IS2]|uniref:Metallo-dependent phosphatase n=1 Tax=Macrolepiota fuliginosa MF-IS2 TaxID=1400762 RepID=A0A9P5XGD8_9AGAR|nr:Metallo-dependent phosphatase [Macrolepiota fuliginosa MF-IS2]
MRPPRQYLVLPTIGIIGLFVFIPYTLGLLLTLSKGTVSKHPDFEHYQHIRTLSPDEFPIGDPHRRVIIVGDIHGMMEPLETLLERVAYDHQNDILVHTGDILSRGRHKGSMKVIEFMTTYQVVGVRGNHDQQIIEWRGWIDWFTTLDGGKQWLSDTHSKWLMDHADGHSLSKWVKQQRKESRGEDAEWWDRIPEDWQPFGDHYRIAKALTEEQYAYLLALPLKLYIPSAHTFIVHAGLLPFNVHYDYDHRRQPLARVPSMPVYSSSHRNEEIETLRVIQELAILRRVPQNTDPWVNLNMRSVLKSKRITRRSNKGTPWAKYWNDQMSMCDGFEQALGALQMQEEQYVLPDISTREKTLPCYPASVIYGHSASRGLDVGRWTYGLDTGCVYGRQLSAMILGPNPLPFPEEWEEDDHDDGSETTQGPNGIETRVDITKKTKTVKFGEHGEAKIVRVSCSR